MNEFTKDDLREIEQIHSNWIKYEVAADNHSLIALCADDIELWPPDARPLLGRAAGQLRVCVSRGSPSSSVRCEPDFPNRVPSCLPIERQLAGDLRRTVRRQAVRGFPGDPG